MKLSIIQHCVVVIWVIIFMRLVPHGIRFYRQMDMIRVPYVHVIQLHWK